MKPQNMLDVLVSVIGNDIALDLGTANTVMYSRGKGVVLNEPSVVAVDTQSRKVLSVGSEAKDMVGRTPKHVRAVRPLRDGVIADFDMCEEMLRYFIQSMNHRRWIKPRMVIAVPSGITGVEQRAVQEAAEYAGARRPVKIIEEPMAAAIGSNMKVWEPVGNMIVDIGGGTTEVAVISLGGIVTNKSTRVGGDEIDEAIMQCIKKELSLMIGERTAEQIKMTLGSAYPLEQEMQAEIRGMDLTTGLPRTSTITTVDVRMGIQEPVNDICDAVCNTLDDTPPELAADIMEKGIMLTGGGALLRGLDQLVANETGIPVTVAHDPLTSVVRGSGQILENLERLSDSVISTNSY